MCCFQVVLLTGGWRLASVASEPGFLRRASKLERVLVFQLVQMEDGSFGRDATSGSNIRLSRQIERSVRREENYKENNEVSATTNTLSLNASFRCMLMAGRGTASVWALSVSSSA